MTTRADLKRLGQLTGMMLKIRLAELHRAAAQRAECEDRLKALQLPPTNPEGLEGAAAELAHLNYQRWADMRREEINRQLAQRTVTWLEAVETARAAFGKDQALGKIASLLPARKPGSAG